MNERIYEQNPWWESPTGIETDPHLAAVAAQPFQRPLPLLETLRTDESIVYTLRGPRQVGKTTALKLLVRSFLEAGVSPTNITYYSLDLERDPEAIVEIVRRSREIGTPGRRYFLLDEISSVPDWQKGIKYLRDQTPARDDFFLLSGSIASDIRHGAERLPGRRGQAADLDRILLPLSFQEFCRAVDKQLVEPSSRISLDDWLSIETSAVQCYEGLAPRLDRLLERYARIGGFPAAVADHLTAPGRDVTDATVRVLWDIVAGDVGRVGRDPAVAMRLLERVAIDLSSPVSWNSLAEFIGVAAPTTAEAYVQTLAEAFELLVVFAWDNSRATRAPKKGKKLYAVDPLVLRFAERITHTARRPALSAVVEGLVATSLFSVAERNLVEAFPVPQALYYWRSTRGREIDFLVGEGSQKLPIEVKYQRRITGRDTLVIRQSYGEGLLLSRNTVNLSGPVRVIPAALFLWLLDTKGH